MFKKIISILVLICMLFSLALPQTVHASTPESGTGTGVSVQLERVDSWLITLILNLLSGHGFEDWFRDNNSCNDYDYRNPNFQVFKLKIKNESNADIVFDKNNQLVLQFTNTANKELGMKLFDFVAYENINKSTRKYTFGSSSLLTYKTLKKGQTWEIWGYTKWMNFSDLSCTIINQVKGNDIDVRLTSKNEIKGNQSDGYSTNTIDSVIKLYNEGNKEIDLDKIRIHYYFKMDGDLKKVAPAVDELYAEVNNYSSGVKDAKKDKITMLPYTFINMGQYSGGRADTYLEIGFPSSKTNYDLTGNYIYKFLKNYNTNWCGLYLLLDNNWFQDLLKYSSNGYDNGKYRWWWKWDKDYTKSGKNYVLNPQISQGTSFVDIDMEIIKEKIVSLATSDPNFKFYQQNHYSFNPGNEIDWENITVYYDGKLIWGNEPGVDLAAPSNVQAIAKNTGIFLKWDVVPGAESYRILRKGPDDSDFVELLDVINENSYTDKTVVGGKTYSYKVKGVTENDIQGTLSEPVSATALDLTGNGLYAEYYNWKDITNSSTTNYDYDQCNNFKTNYVLTNTDLALTRIDPKIDFTGSNTNSYYKWGSLAPDPKVHSDHYTVVWSGAIKPVKDANYVFYTNTDDGVKLWLDINNDGAFGNNELVINNWTNHSATENCTSSVSLKSYIKYKMRMEFFENQGDAVAQLKWKVGSSSSKDVIPTSQLFLDSAVVKPEAPANLTATVNADSTVLLTWDSVLNAAGYKIYQTDEAGNVSVITVSNITQYTTPALEYGDYKYSVSAFNEGGESDKSAEVPVRIGLTAPLNLLASVSNGKVSLTWDEVDGATNYKIYRVSDSITTTVSSITASHTDGDVLPGKSYSYSVAAMDNGSEGARSNEASAIIPPGAPSKLAANQEIGGVKLTWSAGAGAQSYTVYRKDSESGALGVIASGVQGTSFTDSEAGSGGVNGKTYYYVVVAVSNGRSSNNSNMASVTVYPYGDTVLGLLKYNFINSSGNPQNEFVLGAYVPVVMELKLSSAATNLKLQVDKKLLPESSGNPFETLVLSSSNLRKVYKGSDKIEDSHIAVENQFIQINESFNQNDIIKIEFAVKITSTNVKNITAYYDKAYKIGFTLIAGDNDSNDANNKEVKITLDMRVLNPNKLN